MEQLKIQEVVLEFMLEKPKWDSLDSSLLYIDARVRCP